MSMKTLSLSSLISTWIIPFLIMSMPLSMPLSLSLSTCRSASAADRPDLPITDFEGPDYGDWKTTGEAFGPGPAKGTRYGAACPLEPGPR